jgi:pimeloyl-ACP methyl ester carboxylesterase
MAIRNIVLVHGAFVDGSGWQDVYDRLAADGYRVAVVQNPTLSLAGDVAATRQVVGGLDGPAVLVGHSYGGAVITEAGNHPDVAALAYIAAYAPDEGESLSTLIAEAPADAPPPTTPSTCPSRPSSPSSSSKPPTPPADAPAGNQPTDVSEAGPRPSGRSRHAGCRCR